MSRTARDPAVLGLAHAFQPREQLFDRHEGELAFDVSPSEMPLEI
jgi:hypothetical protein